MTDKNFIAEDLAGGRMVNFINEDLAGGRMINFVNQDPAGGRMLNLSGDFANSAMGAAIPGAAGNVISDVVNNLFHSGVIKAQKDAIQIQSSLAILTQQQQADLASKLQQSSTDTDRMKILTDAVTQIEIAQSGQASKSKTTTAIIVVSSAFALLIGVFIYKRSQG